ncbi:Asp23/Gls24 family envelope stress response protein [Neofamilia massiliensis]|uniref:Asp23/Gls24 family envelope stress response protein n=1 Tax=Neofamilia massiliensis TaxID=1673724 RepID=UPI0006BB829F|nr:Asp23/Gls24 family envelope stress response protein [Neofamilia massiliensis]
MSIKFENELGTIVLESDVIATIAGHSALQSYGIVGMASKNTKEGIFELLKLDYITKGILVNIEDNDVSIDLNVILEYGMQIEVVAQNIVDNVKYNIKQFTGLDVDHVNVIVQGVRVD